MNSLTGKSNAPSDVSPAHQSAIEAKPLVLVVEDHDDTRFMLEYLLGIYGCRVALAADGEDALHVAESEHPDLILMDMSLPRLDGFATTRRIRALAALHDVPIVFLSGYTHPALRAEALAIGGNDYLTKPFVIGQLENVIQRHLGKTVW
jgi:CheY-like chemotaxis protein